MSEEEFQAKKAELLASLGLAAASDTEADDELRSRVLALRLRWPGLTADQLASEAKTTTENVEDILGAE